MRLKRHTVAVVVGVAFVAVPAMGAPPEPVVVTQLPDPDPDFVPLPEPKRQGRSAAQGPDENPTLDQAMQDLGRTLGQAAMVEHQQVEARCKAGVPADASAEQRFAWAASCRYSRH